MKLLNETEVTQVNGGCYEHCWGDFSIGSFGASILGGAVAGSVGGPIGSIGGAAGGAVAYVFEIMWTDDE